MCNVECLMCKVKMKKTYQNPRVEIHSIDSCSLMIPVSPPLEPAPQRHWRPGPGASYDPQGSVV